MQVEEKKKKLPKLILYIKHVMGKQNLFTLLLLRMHEIYERNELEPFVLLFPVGTKQCA